jgi:vacuolar-type H+-ATPase subunit I/STV1
MARPARAENQMSDKTEIARLQKALQEAERERNAYSETLTSVGHEHKKQKDRAEAAEAREAALREALIGLSRIRTTEDGNCWCPAWWVESTNPTAEQHHETCAFVRDALAADPESEEAPE